MLKRVLRRGMLVVATISALIGAIALVDGVDIVVLVLGALSSSPRTAGALALAAGGVAWAWLGRRSTRRMRGIPAPVVLGSLACAAAVVGGLGMGREWREQTVRFAAVDATLEATLFTPRDSSARHPAIVMVAGSAPFRRGLYFPWADRLARAGFVVLVADKRGVGPSGGDFERENNSSRENLTRLAGDVTAGIDFLAARNDVDRTRIGLVGLSQAGWTIPIAAAADRRVAFFAVVTGPAVSVREEGEWSRLRGDDHARALVSVEVARTIVDTIAPGGVDAREALVLVTQPGFWLFGDDDNSIPSRKSARVLDSLVALGASYSHATFPGYGHLVIGRGDGQWLPAISTASLDTLAAWLVARAR